MAQEVGPIIFSPNPSLMFIELTKSCEYTCRHCRASAQLEPLPDEMNTAQIIDILDSIDEIQGNKPLIIYTGGNPLRRHDFQEIINYTNKLNISYSVSPPGSELLTNEILIKLKKEKCRSMSLSLDGDNAVFHEWLRNMEGSFDLTMKSADNVLKSGINLQINTTVMKENFMELPGIASILKSKGIATWELFFLITTGRGKELEPIDNDEAFALGHWLAWLRLYGFNIRTVEFPQYRMLLSRISEIDTFVEYINKLSAERRHSRTRGESILIDLVNRTTTLMGYPEKKENNNQSVPSSRNRSFSGTLFISNNGDVYLSGFLPIKIGNVKTERIDDILKKDTIIPKITERKNLKGKCGVCVTVSCIGSRARAFATYNDPLAEDPICFPIIEMNGSKNVMVGENA
ncbi:MAG: radical SAM protein [Thermoplasmataceae archaeon]